MIPNDAGFTALIRIGRAPRTRTGSERRQVGAILALVLLIGGGAATAVAATTIPVLWTAGGLTAGNDGAGNSTVIAADASGNVAVVSGPSLARDLAVTSYTAAGSFRWRSAVHPSTGTYRGGWVAAAPNGDFVAVGHNVDSHGYARSSTLVRYASDGTLQWRVDLVALVTRVLVDTGGNTYLAFGAQDAQVHKYSATGVLLWTTGATGTFAASSLALSPDQADVVVTGSVVGGATWMTAAFSAATGTRRWQVTAAEGTAALDVVVDASRVYVAGQGNVGINGFLTVVAYDRATGARLWRTDANPPTCCATGGRIALAPDGSLVVAGHTATGGYFDWWIVALNANGAVRWQARRDAAVTGDELPAAVFVLADGTTVVSGTGGPVTRDILGNSYMQGVTAGYSPNGTLLWEAFSRLPTAWATALPNGDVCATGGYDALITCWRIPGATANRPPTAAISATPSTGTAPLPVSFIGSGSSDPDGTVTAWAWAFGDGATSTQANPSHTYTGAGTFVATLTVTDNGGASASTTATIVASAPAATVPGAPALNTATPGSNQVALAWSAPSSNGGSAIAGYKVYRSTTSGAETLLTTLGNVTSYTNTGLTNGQTYFYKVSAVNGVGEGVLSGEKSATPVAGATIPGAPTLTAGAVGRFQHGIRLTWSGAAANGSPITGYRIYRGTTSGGEVFLSAVGNVTTFTDTSNAARRTYYYRVSAVNGIGEGPLSNEGSASSR